MKLHGLTLDTFTVAYLTAALFTSTGDDDQPLDKTHSFNDLSEEAILRAHEDCVNFQVANATDIGTDVRDAGGDFWLTRNGHGCGFWDGDWEEQAGERLTEASKRAGECDLYKGDDGKLYFA